MAEAPILICFDGTEGARNAITAAASLLAGRKAVVLDVAPIVLVAESYAAPASEVGELDHLGFEAALARAEVGAELAREAGFAAEARADVDSPTWEGVLEVAHDVDAAVIVLGSRGLNGVHELLEGSVSHEVAQHAGRPVLVVPPRREVAGTARDADRRSV